MIPEEGIPGVTVDGNGAANSPTMTFFTARGGSTNEGRMTINGMVVAASFNGGGVSSLAYDANNVDEVSVVVAGESLIVYVHIADVAFHVRPGTALDREAARRALSVYVPGRVEPMLPPQLSKLFGKDFAQLRVHTYSLVTARCHSDVGLDLRGPSHSTPIRGQVVR